MNENYLALRYPILYLCGPMTGKKDFNRPLFDETARSLRASGYDVRNPGDNPRPEREPWQAFMRDSIKSLMDASGLATIPGWQYSRGAKIEVDLARHLGIPVRTAEQWLTDANVLKMKAIR